MANFLFKKSYKLSTFKNVKYDHLWGSKGVFTTIRVYGESPKYIFLKEHFERVNQEDFETLYPGKTYCGKIVIVDIGISKKI